MTLLESPFDNVAGLPAHPLVVHLAVVLLPLGALVLVGLVALRRFRAAYALPTVLALTVGAVTAFVAKLSGEALAERVGKPAQHASYGELLPWFALLLVVLAWAWYLLDRRDRRREDRDQTMPTLVTGVLAGLAAVLVIVWTVLTGHSGSEAVWGSTAAEPANTSSPSIQTTPASTPTPTAEETPASATSPAPTSAEAAPSPTESAAASYTLTQVAEHNSPDSCWAAIDGKVYDLTAWISQHPGGGPRIERLCGTDATSAFSNQHGSQAKPAAALANFEIGALAG